MYDLIGDIHGHADELVRLLEALGYQKSNGSYRHPERKVIFLGDFIDRGPKIREVLEVVQPMVEDENALAIMGNHELNALAFHTEDPNQKETFLRKRDTKNIRQHGQTILQLSDKELEGALDWFRTLPLWVELDGLRAIHACWDPQAVSIIAQAVKEHGGLTETLLHCACKKGSDLFARIDVVLKGKEAKLPDGISFKDKEGHVRTDVRTRWYLSPAGKTYRNYAFETGGIDCDLDLDQSVINQARPYSTTDKPVFVGHYWLAANRPAILADNVACLDYSVAKGGFLCAYRWSGEQTLSNENFVWVK